MWSGRRPGFLIILLLIAAANLLGQSSPPSAPGGPPPVIGAEQVIPRALEVETRLREIQSRLTADSNISDIRSELPELTSNFEQWWKARRESLAKTWSLQRAQEIKRECAIFQIRSNEWNKRLEDRSQKVEAFINELDGLQAQWAATDLAAAKEKLPTAVRHRITAVLRAVLDTADQARAQRADVLSLQNKVSDLQRATNDALEQTDRAQKELRGQLLAADSPPLWKVLSGASARKSLAEQFADMGGHLPAILDEFLVLIARRLLLHLFLFAALIVMLFLARRRLTPLDEQDAAQATVIYSLRHPIYSALLIALLATPVIYPNAPAPVAWLAMIVAAVPLIGLLPGLLPASMRWIIYALVALFVLDHAGTVLPEDSLLRRLLLLTNTVLALAAIWLSARRARKDRLIYEVAPSVAPLAVFAIPAIAVSALAANVFGRVALSDLLTSALLGACYLAVVLFTGTRVLDGVATALVRSSLGQKFYAARYHGAFVVSRLHALIKFCAVLLWALITLRLFHIMDPLVNAGTAFLQRQVPIGSARISPGDLVAFAVTLFVAYWFSRLIRFVLQVEVFPRVTLARGIPAAISVLTSYTILLIGFLLALAAAGFDLSRITILASAFGVGVGFGLQTIVNNFVSGLILVFEHPLGMGDIVQMGPMWGTVKHVGFRATVISTFEGADVIVPNADLVSREVVNWSRSDRLRRGDISIRVAHDTDPHLVMRVLLQAAQSHPEVLATPPPEILLDRVGESSLDFTLRFWTELEKFVRVCSETTAAAYDAVRKAGIRIPFPQMDLHLRSPATSESAPQGPGGEAGDH